MMTNSEKIDILIEYKNNLDFHINAASLALDMENQNPYSGEKPVPNYIEILNDLTNQKEVIQQEISLLENE